MITGAAKRNTIALDDVLKTDALFTRPRREPQYGSENKSLLQLADAMADAPQTILQRLVEAATSLCGAESAGISILEDVGSGPVFRWRAVTGQVAHIAGGSIPRDESPCGIVIERDAVLLFVKPATYFPRLAAVRPAFEEILLAPFHDGGKAIGTIWAIHHSAAQFDGEDARLLVNVATLMSAAYQLSVRAEELTKANGAWQKELAGRERVEAELRTAHAELEKRVRERTADLHEANRALREEIAERELAKRFRQQLLHRLVTAQEEERRRIARELHDHMGQLLAALSIRLKSIADSGGNATPERLEIVLEIASEIGREIHDLALELRPTALDDVGLRAALTDYLETWSARTGLVVDFQSRGMEAVRLPLSLETAFYRITQEALTNVLKHAQSRHVSVLLEFEGREASLIIEDDGVGFAVDERYQSSESRQRLGLIGMQERIAAENGDLQIESSIGRGTTLIARVKVASEANHGTYA